MTKNFPLLALVAFGLVAGALGKIADQEFLDKQKKIWELCSPRFNFEKTFPEWVNIGRTHNISDSSLYTKQGVAEKFMQHLRHGMLPRDAVFSPFYPVLLEEATSLFELFYYAKDFETFANTAAWARENLNFGQYFYAMSVAVIHRSDTAHIQMPPFYSILPENYFNAELLPKLIESRTRLVSTESGTEKQEIVVPLNYSEWYARYTRNDEHKLNYFREDVFLNNIYELTNLAHPFWASAKEYNFLSKIRGEMFFFSHKINLARYYFERLSHGLGDIETIDWYGTIHTGYYPSMSHANGLPFPQRAENSRIPAYNNEALEELRSYRARIFEAIDSGMILAANGSFIPLDESNGLEYLGNIVEGNADSVNREFYGNVEALFRQVLGFSPEPLEKHKVVPSALQNYATSPRDPIFWSYLKQIVDVYERYVTKRTKRYTFEQLDFPGVKIQSIEISKLVTYFDDIDHWVDGYPKGRIVVRQQHLNHHPVNYTINVYSDVATKAAINVFLGPADDLYGNECDIVECYKYYMSLDHWFVDLKPGSNEFVRHSYEAWVIKKQDPPSFDVFYESIIDAINGGKPFEYEEQVYGYPDRFFIPKGRKDGLRLKFFFYVGPVKDTEIEYTSSKIWGSRGYKMQPQGFPLDRPPFSSNFTLPNFQFKDVLVWHEE